MASTRLLLATLTVVATTAGRAAADAPVSTQTSVEADGKWWLGGYVDVPPYINHGFSAYATARPARHSRLELGVGVFKFDQPSGYVTFTDSANMGFGVNSLAVTGLVNYYLGIDPLPHFGSAAARSPGGLFVGGYLGYWWQTVSLAADSAVSDHAFVAVQAGYQWFPFDKVFYLAPSVGAALLPKLGGNETVDGRAYQDPAVTPIFFVAAGFELGR